MRRLPSSRSRAAAARATRTFAPGWPTQGNGAKGKLDPLPQMKPYEPFAYNAFDLPDPFKPRKIEPHEGRAASSRPTSPRRKEPLEAYPLESLKMVGTLAKGKTMYALVRTPDKDLYQVRQGNYLGQNFGVITGVSDGEIKLKELVQDGAGDWTERSSTLQLIQTDARNTGAKKMSAFDWHNTVIGPRANGPPGARVARRRAGPGARGRRLRRRPPTASSR